jgi:DNA helicase-2/ATP-dependent DNA helicase PcrA
LTVHRAKGLEWDVVFLPALVDQVFPTGRVTDNWVKSAAALPAELRGDAATVPHLRKPGEAGFQAYEADLKADLRRAEDRLAYVAVTRARQFLVATGHLAGGDVRPKLPRPT